MSPFLTPSTPTRYLLRLLENTPLLFSQVLLVVNLASFWGYTPQYYALNALTERVAVIIFLTFCSNQSESNVFFQYADRPFKILGFPCNQFLRQVVKFFQCLQRWSSSESEFRSPARMPARSTRCFATSGLATISCLTLKCLPSLMWTGKIRTQFMNFWRAGALQFGPNSRPRTSSTMSPTTKMTFGEEMQAKLLKRYLQMRKTLFRWNFEKFLVNHQGQPVRRYDESLDPSELVSILKKETKSHLTPASFPGSRYWRPFGPVRAGPCILNPHSLKI